MSRYAPVASAVGAFFSTPHSFALLYLKNPIPPIISELNPLKSQNSQKKNHCRSFTLEEDLPRLAEVLSDYPDIRLVVIDPIKPFNARVDRGIPSGTISSTTRGGS